MGTSGKKVEKTLDSPGSYYLKVCTTLFCYIYFIYLLGRHTYVKVRSLWQGLVHSFHCVWILRDQTQAIRVGRMAFIH